MKEIRNHIAEYLAITAASMTSTAAPSASTTAATTTTTELSLSLSAVIYETIHIDCLIINSDAY